MNGKKTCMFAVNFRGVFGTLFSIFDETFSDNNYVIFAENSAKNAVISPNCMCGNVVERHSFRIISGDSSKTMRKLYLSTKFPQQEIR